MPSRERRHCRGAALAAARQRAAEAAAAEAFCSPRLVWEKALYPGREGSSPSKLADLPLERRVALRGPPCHEFVLCALRLQVAALRCDPASGLARSRVQVLAEAMKQVFSSRF